MLFFLPGIPFSLTSPAKSCQPEGHLLPQASLAPLIPRMSTLEARQSHLGSFLKYTSAQAQFNTNVRDKAQAWVLFKAATPLCSQI